MGCGWAVPVTSGPLMCSGWASVWVKVRVSIMPPPFFMSFLRV